MRDLSAEKGHVFHLLERAEFSEAARRLEAIQASDPDDPDVWTLTSNLHLLLGDAAGAESALWAAYELGPDRVEPRLLLADVLRKQGRRREARYWYDRAAESGEAVYRSYVADGRRELELEEADHAGRRNLAILCGPDQAFIRPIAAALSDRFDVRTAYVEGKAETSSLQELLDWADVAWFEWCDALLIEASRRLRKSCPVVCRLHSYEIFSGMPAQVNWSFVDHVVFVGPHIERLFAQQTAHLSGPLPDTTVIPNGVDLEQYAFRQHARSHEIAYVGYINYKKNPEMLLQVLAALVKKDSRYRLNVAGRFQDLRYALYFERMVRELSLEKNFVFSGWVDDVGRWLEDKDYLLSTSVLESFGLSIAEGMARGLRPVVHNWVGADETYPRSLLFNTIDEAVGMITEGEVDSSSYRRFIERHYSRARQVDSIERLLMRLAAAGADDAPQRRSSLPIFRQTTELLQDQPA